VDCWQTFDNNGEQAVNVIMDRNICADCHQGIMGESHYHKHTKEIYFTNNIFDNCTAWGLCIQDISNIYVYHNVFYNIGHHAAGFSGVSTGIILKNNIVEALGFL